MRTRIVFLFFALGVLALSARADFRAVTGVDAGPRDVWIRDAGIASPAVFSVHNGNSAFLVVDDPGGAASVASRFACNQCRGSWVAGSGGDTCLNAIQQNALWIGCDAGTASTVSNAAILSVRATEALSAYSEGTAPASPLRWYGPRTTPTAPWFQTIGAVGVERAAIGAVSRGANDYALMVRGPVEDSFLVENNTETPLRFSFTGGAPTWADLQVLPNGFLRGFAVGTGGAQVVTVGLDAGTLTAQNLPPLGVAPYSIGAVAFREGMGDQYGDGVGFLLVTTASYPNVYRAIPDPSAPGRWWAPTTVPLPALSSGAVYNVVRCIDSTYCVLASTASATTTVVTYRNANPPQVESPALVVDEGAADVVLQLAAADLDGDAVFVTLEPEAGSGAYLSALDRDPGTHDGTRWLVTAEPSNTALCGVASQDVRVDVVVSDGLASHVQRDAGFIRVRRTSVPVAPSGGPFLVPAGSPSNTYDLSYPAPLCAVTSVDSGTILQQAPPLQRAVSLVPGNMVRVTFQPPRVWCSADAGIDTYDLTLRDLAMSSDAGTVSFHVLPWGEPEVPFAPGRVELQDAGTSVTYATDATHLCADAGAFPGTDTFWTWSWRPADAGFSTPVVRRSDGSVLPPSGGVTPTATVEAPDCVSGVITFQASNTTRGTGGMSSADAGLTVDVINTLVPLSSGSAGLTAAPGPDGGVVGQVDLSPNLNCLALREAVADLTLFRDDGGVVSAISKSPVPGPYLLPAPNACGGGQFLVEAIVNDATGALAPVQQPVQLPLLPPGLSDMTVPDLIISCGDAGTARATATIGPNQCPSAEISWSSSGAVAIAPATGSPVDLFTASTDFGGLIGMPVDVTATATTETGDAGLSRRVRVLPDRQFILVTHRTDTPVASEARVLGVEVTLTNDTACDVSGIEWHESLQGMRWVEGSVQVGDAGVGAVLDGGELVVPGLSLPAGQSLTLRYSARPTLFGDPSPGGVAVLRSVPISTGGGLAAGQGTCGCQSAAGAWPTLLGLVAAALLRRRRSGARGALTARS